MEVVPASASDVPLALPFARSNVQEWSHLDQLTGVLQQGRVQADHWASGSRAYGKVVESRRVASASGALEQRRHQQLEVFQERGPGGSRRQVVRSSRLCTSSSSTTTSAGASAWRKAPAFDNLQLPLNPLDSSPQKTRASVGRSGSIGGRRPPSRPRSLVGKPEAAVAILEEQSDAARGHDDDEIEVAAPRIEASVAISSEDDEDGLRRRGRAAQDTQIHSGIARKKSSSTEELHCATPDEQGQAENIADDWRRGTRVRRSLQLHGKASVGSPRLERPELPAFKSGSALRGLEALENVFRRGANIADSVNRTLADVGGGDDSILDVDSLAGHLKHEQKQMASSEEEGLSSKGVSKAASSTKRHSFVTVETLKEVRGRLRRLGSPPSDEAQVESETSARTASISEERDDGIVTEDIDKSNDKLAPGSSTRVRSFVYGMDGVLGGARKTVPGTGSLESRTSNRSSSSSGSRSEEWHNRRKSYGFEQVHEHDRQTHLYGSAFKDKHKVESSTDSGICRSSEMVTPWGRLIGSRPKAEENHTNTGGSTQIPVSPIRMTYNIPINKSNTSVDLNNIRKTAANYDQESSPTRGRTTVVTLGSKFEHKVIESSNNICREPSLQRTSSYENSDEDKTSHRRFSEPVTITIPITGVDSTAQSDRISNVEQKKLIYRQLRDRPTTNSEANKPFVVNIKKKESNDTASYLDKRNSFSSASGLLLMDGAAWRKSENWKNSKYDDGEKKRHSLAVDDPEYVKESVNHLARFDYMSGSEDSSQTFSRISASELAKKFDSLSFSKKEQSQPIIQNGMKHISSGISVSFVQNGFGRNEDEDDEFSSSQMNFKKQKKVEFCKTEVHFVADSGRVNIVETDEKPPPTNMFRRRKKNSPVIGGGQSVDPTKNNLPQVRFGDSPYEKQLLGGNDSPMAETGHTIHVEIANETQVTSVSVEKDKTMTHSTSASYQHDADKEDLIYTQANATIPAVAKPEEKEPSRFDSENFDAFHIQSSPDKDNMPRSILKNYRKPRPFHLGENDVLKPPSETEESNQEERWGVRLRPVQPSEQASATAMWRSHVSVSSTAYDVPQVPKQPAQTASSDRSLRESETEFQRQLRKLRPAQKNADVDSYVPTVHAETRPRASPTLSRSYSSRETEDKGVQVVVGSSTTESSQPQSTWTVAERIRQVEEMRKTAVEMRGFSTRVNFGGGEATVVGSASSDDQQVPNQKQQPPSSKAPWGTRHEAEDEKVQDGRNRRLVVHISKADSQKKEVLETTPPPRVEGKVEEDLRKTTTTIKIDLGSGHQESKQASPGMEGRPPVKPERTRRKQQAEVLQSPSLIMKTIRNPVYGLQQAAAPRGSTLSQLAALRELYYSGAASEDSADEEVRSYMSGGGDDHDHESDRASELSGSWSRVRAVRNLHKYKTGYSRTTHEEEAPARPPLPAHDGSRLRSVETLVSTRSGEPKITSIALRYEGDPSPGEASDGGRRDKALISPARPQANAADVYHQHKEEAQDVAPKARPLIAYTERCYGDGESGSMSRRSRKFQENNKTYVIERSKFEQQKEKYLKDENSFVTTKNSTDSGRKRDACRSTNTYTKSKEDSKNVRKSVGRQLEEQEHTKELKNRSASRSRSSSPEKVVSGESKLYKQNLDTLKSTSSASVEEEEYRREQVSDISESEDETYGAIADKKKRSPIYDNVCESVDVVKISAEGKKKVGSREEREQTGRRVSAKATSVVKEQVKGVSRKTATVEKRSDRTATKKRAESPLYENREIISLEEQRKAQQRGRQEQRQHETAMLEELTRAADQILQAVNGYSDDESARGQSSADEARGRRGQASRGALTTISERPHKPGRARPASSASSAEGASERRAAARRDRAARLLQRANSREQLLHARASSSEDALSSLEAEERRPRPPPPRRQRPAAATAAAAPAARAQGHRRSDAAQAAKTTDRTTTKKSQTAHKLRETTKDKNSRTVTAKRDVSDVKHHTSRAANEKLPGSSHGLLPFSSKNKSERSISERRTVVAVMPLRAAPSTNVKKLKQTSSRTDGTQARTMK